MSFCVREYRDTVYLTEHALSTNRAKQLIKQARSKPTKRGRGDTVLNALELHGILRKELYHRQAQQKVLCFYYTPNWLPSCSDLTLGTNWANASHRAEAERFRNAGSHLLG